MLLKHGKAGLLMAILVVILIGAGCASYETKGMAAMAQAADGLREIEASDGSLDVRAVPMLKKETANAYLGIDPSSTGMAPVFFSIQNVAAGPVKIDLSKSFLSYKSDVRSPCRELEEACNRARRSDAEVVGWSVAFGMIGALASGSRVAEANRALESDYQEKQFKPTLINSGGTAEGVIFFDVPKEKQAEIRSAVIAYLDLGSNQPGEIVIGFGIPGTK